MFGLEQIKTMNKNPRKHARSEMSDGQERRNDSPPSNYWSEQGGGDREPIALDMATAQLNPKTVERLNAPHVLMFDAVRMMHAMQTQAEEITQNMADLGLAMATVRREPESSIGGAMLASVMKRLTSKDLTVRMHIEDLASQIDVIAPLNPPSYTKHMGLHHAVHPLRKIINAIREAWASGI